VSSGASAAPAAWYSERGFMMSSPC
jgi:hypothetical protein